jgi:hypothetical protein
MNQTCKRRLGVKVFRLAEVSESEWRKVMPRYWSETKVWWLVPTSVWVVLLIAGAGLVLYEGGSSLLRLEGLALALFAAGKIGGRYCQTDGFQFGYDLGRWDGVCRPMDINDKEREELYFLARGLIYESESETDPGKSPGKAKQALPRGVLRHSSFTPR